MRSSSTVAAVALSMGLMLILGCDDKKSEEDTTTVDTSVEDTAVDETTDPMTDAEPDTATDPITDAEPDTATDPMTDVEPDTLADVPMDVPGDWPTDVPAEWLDDVSAACAAASGFCTANIWDMCPAGYEPTTPDEHLDCYAGGRCCVVAPYSSCSADSGANCVDGDTCPSCWADGPAGLTCEAGRVCCTYVCE